MKERYDNNAVEQVVASVPILRRCLLEWKSPKETDDIAMKPNRTDMSSKQGNPYAAVPTPLGTLLAWKENPHLRGANATWNRSRCEHQMYTQYIDSAPQLAGDKRGKKVEPHRSTKVAMKQNGNSIRGPPHCC
jgi:hypothetical protein